MPIPSAPGPMWASASRPTLPAWGDQARRSTPTPHAEFPAGSPVRDATLGVVSVSGAPRHRGPATPITALRDITVAALRVAFRAPTTPARH